METPRDEVVPNYDDLLPEWCQGCVFAARAIAAAKEKTLAMNRLSARIAEQDFMETIFVPCDGLEEKEEGSASFCGIPDRVCTNPVSPEVALNWWPPAIRPDPMAPHLPESVRAIDILTDTCDL